MTSTYPVRECSAIASASWWSLNRKFLCRWSLAAVLPNVPLLLVRGALHIKFGVLNLDYFLLTLLACEFSPTFAAVLFVMTYLFELVRLLDSLFYFSQADPLFAVRFLGHVHKPLILGWAAAFVLVCGTSLWLWKIVMPRPRTGRTWQTALPIGLVLLALAAMDRANGHTLAGANRHSRSGYRGVDELLLRMPLSVARPTPIMPVAVLEGSASAPLWSGEVSRQREDVVLVLVESMGRILDDAGFAREFGLFSDSAIQQRYNVKQGIVPFTGPTVSGEMRELCRLQTGMYISAATLKDRQPCLPAQYRDAGYQAIAFHGFRAAMFQRSDWYPLLGFTAQHFLGDMSRLPACEGAFYGVCDDAVAGLIRDRLHDRAAGLTPPQFLYWMTLNSHLAVDEKHAPHEICPIAADRHVCAHLAYVQAVLRSIKQIALDPKIGRTAIVLVGDHAPPFLLPEERNRFDGRNVPFVYLEPR